MTRFSDGSDAPPPPDTTPPAPAAGQSIVDVLYSPSEAERAVITCDVHGSVYRIHTEYWYTDERGAAFWCVPSRYTPATFTDTAERARELARERLHQLVHNIPKFRKA
jgi:hypothetical protein